MPKKKKHPNSLKAIKGHEFKKGCSGGPGRPPGPSLKTLLKQALEKADNKEAKAIITALIDKAKDGDIKAQALVFERMEGKETTRLDHTSGGQPVKGYIGVSPDDWGDDEKE